MVILGSVYFWLYRIKWEFPGSMSSQTALQLSGAHTTWFESEVAHLYDAGEEKNLGKDIALLINMALGHAVALLNGYSSREMTSNRIWEKWGGCASETSPKTFQ